MLATVLFFIIFFISEMPTLVVALIGEIFPSAGSILTHETSPFHVNISTTFAE